MHMHQPKISFTTENTREIIGIDALVNRPAKGKQDMHDRKRQDMKDICSFLPWFRIKSN